MKRVIFLKSADVEKGDVINRYRGGFTYNLDEEDADLFIGQRLAYLEGEEPPFDAATVEVMNRIENLEDEARVEAAARLYRHLQDKAEKEAAIEEYVTAKRAARERGRAANRERGNS